MALTTGIWIWGPRGHVGAPNTGPRERGATSAVGAWIPTPRENREGHPRSPLGPTPVAATQDPAAGPQAKRGLTLTPDRVFQKKKKRAFVSEMPSTSDFAQPPSQPNPGLRRRSV